MTVTMALAMMLLHTQTLIGVESGRDLAVKHGSKMEKSLSH